VEFIDAHRGRFGVEPICRVLTEHGRLTPIEFETLVQAAHAA
jgi:hypothetical protein